MTKETISISEVVELLKENIDDERLRTNIYYELINLIELCGYSGLNECSKVDPLFDEILRDMSGIEDAEDSEETQEELDWDDQGRESF